MKDKKNSKKEKKRIKKSEEKQEASLEEEVREAEKAITHSDYAYALRDKTKLRETLNEAEKEIEEKEEEQDFFEEPIRQIPISSETSAPVLERIIQRETPINNFVEVEQPKEREERRIDYSPISNAPNYGFARNDNREEEEKKYETNFVPPVLSRAEFSGESMRREFLKPQNEGWQKQSANNSELDDINFVEEERMLPFEQQKKYKRIKLR